MKKDKKWFIDKWSKERDKTSIHEPMYYFINDFIADVKELDEPEVLSQEWIDRNKTSIDRKLDGTPIYKVREELLQNLIAPKRELPVIPKFVAEWIETHIEQGFDLYPALKRLEDNSRLWTKGYNWYRENTLDFTIAYLTKEYKVEEEPLYCALIKGHELIDTGRVYWDYDKSDDSVFISELYSLPDNFLTEMSKSEWNKLGINDSNADFIKVEELEE